uniref:DUF569 domain-containing protein n=1 Tax=Aegilops tauschii subsp. strangulata TaxID=200361 RepID=A0A453QRN3_AEGTS
NSFRFSVSPPSPELQETKNPSSPPPPRSAHRQMEQFQDGHHVRLRSREHGMYLHANKDGRGVSLRRPRASMNAAWAVHLYQDDDDAQYVLLHSAAYGGYLAAMDAPAPRRAARLRGTGGGGRQVAARQVRDRGLHPAPPRQRPLPPRQREVPPLEQRRQRRRLRHRQHDDALGRGAHPRQGGHA